MNKYTFYSLYGIKGNYLILFTKYEYINIINYIFIL